MSYKPKRVTIPSRFTKICQLRGKKISFVSVTELNFSYYFSSSELEFLTWQLHKKTVCWQVFHFTVACSLTVIFTIKYFIYKLKQMSTLASNFLSESYGRDQCYGSHLQHPSGAGGKNDLILQNYLSYLALRLSTLWLTYSYLTAARGKGF